MLFEVSNITTPQFNLLHFFVSLHAQERLAECGLLVLFGFFT